MCFLLVRGAALNEQLCISLATSSIDEGECAYEPHNSPIIASNIVYKRILNLQYPSFVSRVFARLRKACIRAAVRTSIYSGDGIRILKLGSCELDAETFGPAR